MSMPGNISDVLRASPNAKIGGGPRQQPLDNYSWGNPSQVDANGQCVIRFTVPGTPVAKPRQTQRDRWAKRPCVLRYREYADRVREVAGTIPDARSVERIEIVAYFEPPKSWSKANKALAVIGALIGVPHRSKPDLDNILKAILDSLWPDNDSAIADCRIVKRWGVPARLEVTIYLD